MIEDRYGRIALEEDDIIDVMMTDPDVTIKRALVKDCDLTHVQELLDEVYDFQQYSNLDIPVTEFERTKSSYLAHAQ